MKFNNPFNPKPNRNPKPSRHGFKSGFNMIMPDFAYYRASKRRTPAQVEADLKELNNRPPVFINGKEVKEVFKHFIYGYYASDFGRVYCKDSNKFLVLTPRKKKKNKDKEYLAFQVCYGSSSTTFYVHRVVAALFCKHPMSDDNYAFLISNDDWKAHHININPKDNRACNLIWLTKEDHERLHQDINHGIVSIEDVNTSKKIIAYINNNYR